MSKSQNILKIISYAFLLLFIVNLFYHPIPVSDTGWHLATGRWILENNSVPKVDPFPFTEEAQPWTFTQWLGSTLLYLSYHLGVEEGLKFFKAFILSLPVGLFFIYARRKVPLFLLITLCICLGFGLNANMQLRPLIFNFLFIYLVINLIERYIKSPSKSYLFMGFIIALIWGQLHLGSFVYGLLLLGIYLLSALIQKKWETFKSLLFLSSTYLLGLAISPYGIDGATYPYKVFLFPEFINVYKYTFNISENRAPAFMGNLSGLWAYTLIILGIASLILNKKRTYTDCLLFIIATFFFLSFSRAAGFFAIVSSIVIVRQLTSINTNLKKYNTVFSILVLIFIGAYLWHDSNKFVYQNNNVSSYKSLARVANHPLNTITHLKKNGFKGNVFCNEHIGSAILFHAYPEMKPLINGRQLDHHLFDLYLKVAADPIGEWERAHQKYNFDLVVLDSSVIPSAHLIIYLLNRPDWKIILIKNSIITFTQTESDEYEQMLINSQISKSENDKLIQLMQRPKESEINFNFQPTATYIDLLDEGITLNQIGYYKASLKHFVDAAQINPELVRTTLTDTNSERK